MGTKKEFVIKKKTKEAVEWVSRAETASRVAMVKLNELLDELQNDETNN